MTKKTLKCMLCVAGLVALVLLPKILPKMQIIIIVEIAYFALFAVSYNLLFGYSGLLSFGHSAYFGIGAYSLALLLNYFPNLSLPLAVLMGGVGGAVGGLLAGPFCVRLKGAYFALLTLAFNQFFFAIALKWRSVTGGDDGIGLERPGLWLPGLGVISMDKMENAYYFVIATVIVCLWVIWFITQTPFGNTLRTIKENNERAEFIGHNVYHTKITIYVISGFFAGIAGALYGFYSEFVSTSVIDTPMSIQVLFMAFIGGIGSFFGPILGTTVYIYFTDWVSRITDRWEFILGVLFILLVLYANKGLIGIVSIEKLKHFFTPGPKTKEPFE